MGRRQAIKGVGTFGKTWDAFPTATRSPLVLVNKLRVVVLVTPLRTTGTLLLVSRARLVVFPEPANGGIERSENNSILRGVEI